MGIRSFIGLLAIFLVGAANIYMFRLIREREREIYEVDEYANHYLDYYKRPEFKENVEEEMNAILEEE